MINAIRTLAIMAGIVAVLAILATLLIKPDVNDAEFWKGAPNAVYRHETRPGPPGTPAPVWMAQKEIQTAMITLQSGELAMVANVGNDKPYQMK
jgi:hypothetical protein